MASNSAIASGNLRLANRSLPFFSRWVRRLAAAVRSASSSSCASSRGKAAGAVAPRRSRASARRAAPARNLAETDDGIAPPVVDVDSPLAIHLDALRLRQDTLALLRQDRGEDALAGRIQDHDAGAGGIHHVQVPQVVDRELDRRGA